MFSYEEMIDISKKYRFKLDFNTNQFSVIDSGTKEKLSDSEETNKIKGLLYAKEIITQHVMDVSKNKSPEQREQIGREEFEKLQKELIQIGLKGEYTIGNTFKSGLQGYSPTESFLSRSTIEYDAFGKEDDMNLLEKKGYRKESALHFINSLLFDNGKKVTNIENLNRTQRAETTFKFDVRELTMQEKLNPNNPAYSKSQPKVQLTPEQQAKRREFVEQLIQTYLMVETDKMYEDRVQGESSNMKFAAKNSQTINLTSINIPKIMRLLLAAKNVSLYGQKDYLEEIISNPSINQALLTIKDSPEYAQMVQKGKSKQNSGELVNGKPFGHRETIGERDARIANNLLQQSPNAITVAKQKLALGRNLKFQDERHALFYSAVARTLGKTPSYTKGNDGTFEFDSGEELNR